jgi:hypothetical protein
MRLGALAALLSLLASACEAAETAQFLRILPGARPMAMGEAYTAVADDLNALNTNPSGLSRVGGRQAGFMHAELYGGARYDFMGYAQPVGPAAFGLSLQRLTVGGLEGRDAAGNQTGSFAAADTALSAAFSSRLPDSTMRAGFGVKLIESRLAETSARTMAVDLGLQKPLEAGGYPLMLGAAVRNLGPGLKLGDQREPLPLAVSLGGAVRLGGTLLLSMDVTERPHSGERSVAIGTEYAILPQFSLRSGYAGNASQAPMSGLGFGFGLRLMRATVDYGFTPGGVLGAQQRLGLTTRF